VLEIHYRANLHIGPLSLGYAARLPRVPGATVTRIGMMAPPVIEGTTLHWPGDAGAAAIEWAGAMSREIELWRSGAQRVSWNPVVLNGEVRTGNSRKPARGYAERLTMNFNPARLGLKKLKWGRFCGERRSLAWIEWEGPISKKLALLDGAEVPLVQASRPHIHAGQATLVISEPVELVCETIGEGALKNSRLLRLFAASNFLRGLETKWFARGVLDVAGERDTGRVVYEEVTWP